MRKTLGAILILLGAITAADAQTQEQKLLDRLLRPRMDLKNTEQNKQFTNFDLNRSSVSKTANVREFGMQREAVTREFAGTDDFSTPKYRARMFRDSDSSAYLARNTAAYADRSVGTDSAYRTRTAMEDARSSRVRDYPSVRPFLDEGKSQKSLKQHDRPMTIDEVRELLNKNK